MANPKGTLAITGATGYVGGAVVREAVARGFGVRALGRRELRIPGVEFVPYDLGETGPLDALEGCIAIIHLAADTAARSHAEPSVELDAAKRIVEAATRHNVRLIYVSSQTADPHAQSGYARAKGLVEQQVLLASGCIVRPGLVYGGEERGLFGELCRLVRGMPVLPAFLPAARVQPVHVDELAAALITAVEQDWIGTRNIARERPMSFTEFLRIVAEERVHRRRIFVPCPVALVFALAPLIERVLPRGPELGQLRSLYSMPTLATSHDLNEAGLSLRPVTYGMHRSGNGRRGLLLREADILLAYILRRRASSSLLRRYVKAVEVLDGGIPLALPRSLRRFPFAVALFDRAGSNGSGSKLHTRIGWACRIGEASVQGSQRFLPVEGSAIRLVAGGFGIGRAVLTELLFRFVRTAFARRVNKFMRLADEGPQ